MCIRDSSPVFPIKFLTGCWPILSFTSAVMTIWSLYVKDILYVFVEIFSVLFSALFQCTHCFWSLCITLLPSVWKQWFSRISSYNTQLFHCSLTRTAYLPHQLINTFSCTHTVLWLYLFVLRCPCVDLMWINFNGPFNDRSAAQLQCKY